MHMTRTQVEDVLLRHGIRRALCVEDIGRHEVTFYLPMPVTTGVVADLEMNRTPGVQYKVHVLPWWKTFGTGRFIWRIKQ